MVVVVVVVVAVLVYFRFGVLRINVIIILELLRFIIRVNDDMIVL